MHAQGFLSILLYTTVVILFALQSNVIRASFKKMVNIALLYIYDYSHVNVGLLMKMIGLTYIEYLVHRVE